MTDDTQQDPATDDQAGTNQASKTEPDTGADRLTAEVEKWKALARKHEAEVKTLRPAASRLAEIEESTKSETQRVTDRLAATERERDEARAGLLRFRIAAQHGIAAEDADLFLTATDEETLMRQAERLTAREAAKREAEAEADAEQRRTGNFVPREGHGNNHTDADTVALSVLGFGV